MLRAPVRRKDGDRHARILNASRTGLSSSAWFAPDVLRGPSGEAGKKFPRSAGGRAGRAAGRPPIDKAPVLTIITAPAEPDSGSVQLHERSDPSSHGGD